MLEVFDKYKFGIIAALLCYLGIFMYTNIMTYDHIVLIKPFIDEASIDPVPVNEKEIIPEDIIVPDDFSALDAKNMSQNVHDKREASYENYSENRSSEQIKQDIKNLEKQMANEAGGSAERARIQSLIEKRKKEQEAAVKNPGESNSSQTTAPNKYAGNTVVSYDLHGRNAHQNNDYYVRNPGYTCSNANGVVVINVKTNANGDVTSAEYNSGASKNTTNCMIEQALKYAKISRFSYSSDASQQSGYIKYTFIYK